jgi:hypothetical protein
MIQGFSGGLLNRQLIYQTDLPSFQRDFASLKTLDHGTGPAITFTRASGATFFDANGVLQTAANDAPRFDHDPATGASRGLLIEEARTNSLRNSQGGGATVGVIGSGGALPTNWSTFGTTGLSVEVVALGTENGMSYLDFRLSGTTATGAVFLAFESAANIVAATGQTWTASIWHKLVSGSSTNFTAISLQHRGANSTGGTLLESGGQALSLSANLSQISRTITFSVAGVERTRSGIGFSFSSGVAIDITLRLAAPQLEQGAFATSYIPTTTAAATRAADSAVVTPISSFYNQDEGTLFAEAAGIGTIVNVDNASAEERLFLTINTSAIPQFFATALNATQASITIGAATTPAQIVKFAGTAKQDDLQAARDGTLGTADTSAVMPSGITRMQLGQRQTGTRLNGHIRKLAYWPKRLTNTLLEQITT